MGKNKDRTKEEIRTKKKNTWKMIGVISIIIMLIGSFVIGANWNKKEDPISDTGIEITSAQARIMAEDFVKANMFGVENAKVLGVEEAGNMWKVTFDLDSDGVEIVDAYVTKDGKYFVPAAYEMNQDIVTNPSGSADLSSIPVRDDLVNVLYFWGDGCGFCEQMNKFLTEFDKEIPGILNVIKYETWKDADNAALMMQVANNYGFNPNGVPLVFIGDEYFVGSSESIHNQIRDHVMSNCVGQLEQCQLILR
jgi:thiol-disulfide isomerase/thioredoxin